MSEWKKWKYKNSLHPLEKQVLAIIGNKRWNIKSLERALSENGQNVFQPKDTLINFLTKRPELFCVKKELLFGKRSNFRLMFQSKIHYMQHSKMLKILNR